MKVLKASAVLTLAALFSIACSSPSPTDNKNTAPASTSASNSNAGQPVAIIPNSNASSPSTAPAATSTAPNAAALFKAQKCDTCHGVDGKGKVKGVPNFTDAAWHQKETDAKLIEGIKKGNPPKMPAYEKKLSEDEIKSLVAYVRAFSGK